MTNKMIGKGVTLPTLTFAGLAGIAALWTSCLINPINNSEKKEAAKQEQIQQKDKWEQQRIAYTEAEQAKKKATEEARMARRNGNYTEPQVFNNPDGTTDRYYPVEDLLLHSRSLQILYTDKKTRLVRGVGFNGPIVRDLKENQLPYLEEWDSTKNIFGVEEGRYMVHIGNNDRIHGGVEVLKHGYQHRIQTIDLENKVGEGK